MTSPALRTSFSNFEPYELGSVRPREHLERNSRVGVLVKAQTVGRQLVLFFSPNCQDDAEQPVGEDEVAVQLDQVEEGLGGGLLDPVEVVNLEDRVQLEIKSQLQNQIFHLMIFRLKYIDL